MDATEQSPSPPGSRFPRILASPFLPVLGGAFLLLFAGTLWLLSRPQPEGQSPRPEQVTEEEAGLDLTEENVEATLDEIRPYLAGTGGGELELEAIEEPIVKIRLTGPAASVMTVRVAVTQKLREKMPSIAAVQLL